MNRVVYIAKALGIALATFIIFIIVYSLLFVVSLFMANKKETNLQERIINNQNIIALDLDFTSVSLNNKAGDTLKVETNIKNIEIKEYERKLKISAETPFPSDPNNKIINITIPQDLTLERFKLNVGGGNINIENITSVDWDISLGMSKASFDNIAATGKVKIDNGVGSIEITNSTLNNLDLDNGFGAAKLEASLTGKTKLDNGLGGMNVTILDKKDNYTIDVDNGLGSVNIDGVTIDQERLGSGEKTLSLNNGLGSINIKFTN